MMENKNKYTYKNHDFDQKGLEAKLEKDNLLLKDQIQKLQDTIKNLKYEVPQTEETLDEDNLKPNEKDNNFISNIPYQTKESKKGSPSLNKKKNPSAGNYNTNNYNTNKLLESDLEANDLMFSFNIHSQTRATPDTSHLNGSGKAQIENSSSTKKNGAFQTVDSDEDHGEKLKTKTTIYEKEVLNMNAKTVRGKSKSKEPPQKQLNRQASQKVIVKPNAETMKRHQRNSSLNMNVNNQTTKSKEKTQMLMRQYSNLNKKLVEKIQCKTQENSESLEEQNNGKTQRNRPSADTLNKANLSKIKLKLPNKDSAKKISTATIKKLINSNQSSHESMGAQAVLIDNLRNEIARLNLENERLRNELEEEKKMNLKFKDFAQDLMKYYDKGNSINAAVGKLESSTSRKRPTSKSSNICEPEKDFNNM